MCTYVLMRDILLYSSDKVFRFWDLLCQKVQHSRYGKLRLVMTKASLASHVFYHHSSEPFRRLHVGQRNPAIRVHSI